MIIISRKIRIVVLSALGENLRDLQAAVLL